MKPTNYDELWKIITGENVIEAVAPLRDALLRIDRISSACLAHGSDDAKPLAREIFEICEAALAPKPSELMETP